MVSFLRRMRLRSVTLSSKILVLLAASVLVSAALSGWIIYDGIRDKAWAQAGESLLQAATSSGLGLRQFQGLDAIQSPGDVEGRPYQALLKSLRDLQRFNRFGRRGLTGRVAVLRFLPARSRAYVVAGTDSADLPGRRQDVDGALYKAVESGAAELEPAALDAPVLTAYVSLGGSSQGSYVLVMQRDTVFLHQDLLGTVLTIVLGALAGVALSLLGGWLLTGQITKPLRAFIDVMRLMQSTGDYGMRIDLHPEDRDMSVVESTFQSLVRRMQESRDREEQSYWSTLQALVTALDVRDNETAGHSMRVTRYSLAIGERLRLRSEAMEQLRQGALLHDIGKIGVPDAILRKPGKLSPEEWLEMRKHPAIGRNFLEDIAFLRPAMAVVYCHHERWDGKGYPQGLAEDAIPLTARVFAVADALDAITSRRYYKQGRSFREAQEEIEACAGSHFDPAVVKAFLSIPEKVFLRIKQETSLSGVELERLRKSAA